MVNKIYINFTSFHVATEQSTEASGEETTAASPGKAPNNMEKEMKIFFIEISWVFQCSIRLMSVVFVSCSYRGKH